ncbi:MAG: aminoacyl-tRNA hydrolase [Parcubacteria group bacterium]|nr:aminoacyl-tRNA hydrolase [Parcubacteria group bacterium]|tara:strand:- start:8 stop:598 length:591 start_codon:yes stop_codon:yes gene_type:complete
MKCIIVGLGNPGKEYEHTRHNAGRLAVTAFEATQEFGGFVTDKKTKSELSKGSVGKHTAILLQPNTFMNKSGSAVKELITNAKVAERLIVVYDDIDLPFGTLKIAFGRGSGGHKGIESIIRAVKTKKFVRVRIGVAPMTPSGKIKKPVGEKKVHDFLLGEFTKKEHEALKKIYKAINASLESIIIDGRVKAMNIHN